MKGVNKVVLVGYLAGEPEYRVTQSGTPCASVTLATSEQSKDQSGNMTEVTEWHRLVFWKKLADIAHQYLHKGSLTYVEGKLKTRSYQDKQGQKKYVTEIIVSDLTMLGGKSDNNQQQPGNYAPDYQQNQPPVQQNWQQQPAQNYQQMQNSAPQMPNPAPPMQNWQQYH